MTRTRFSLPLAAASAVLTIFFILSPASVDAVEHVVPTDFASIQAAITAAVAGDSVLVEPGIYLETITLKDGVSISGRETARTFLSGNGNGTVISADGPINTSIRNFTFVNASIGVRSSNNPGSVSITNNVFQVGMGGVAVAIQTSPLTEVVNNVFFQNGTAVSCDSDIKIINNIFANNSATISNTTVIPANIFNNAFSSNVQSIPTGTAAVTGDPLFVDPGNRDFHLRENSPCIDAGNAAYTDNFDFTQSDIGAYGGPFADLTPFPVAGLTITSSTDTSISLTWSPNNCYLMTSAAAPGTYSIWYGNASGDYNGQDAEGGMSPSPIDLLSPTVSFAMTGLNPSPTAPAAPVLDQPSPRDSKLVLAWSAVSGATGYKVYYGIASQFENTLDVGDTTSHTLTGLTNGQTYRVAVSAYAQAQYFIVVSATYGTDQAFEHESANSPEVSVKIGPIRESFLSNVKTDFPETVTSFPPLSNSRRGCFIATAAYGYYSAPEVQALRDFRDRYLLTTAFGTACVEWYYRHGPAAAAFLNAHPGFKPAVRAALMPAVGAAVFMTRTSTVMKAGVFLMIGSAITFGLMRKRRAGTGGLR